MTRLNFAADTRAGIALVALHGAHWRVTRGDGEVLGYVEGVDTAQGTRYLAKRLHGARRQFLAVGEFWRFDDAVDCFRFG